MLSVQNFSNETFCSKKLCCFILSLDVTHRQVISNVNRRQEKFTVMPRIKDIQARKHVRDGRDFNNIETRVLPNFFFLQGKAPKKIHAILTEILACYCWNRGDATHPWAGLIFISSLSLFLTKFHITIYSRSLWWIRVLGVRICRILKIGLQYMARIIQKSSDRQSWQSIGKNYHLTNAQ